MQGLTRAAAVKAGPGLPLAAGGLGLALLALSLWADPLPRFFQGDSISYLMTGMGWVPPDRSWAFGYLAHGLVAATRGWTAFLVLSNAALLAVALGARRWFDGRPRRPALCHAALALVLLCDPLLAVYTRFYMADFLALACFLGFLDALRRGLAPGARFWPALLAAAAFAAAAVFLRVAYAAVVAGACALTLLASLRSGCVRSRWRIGAALLLAPLAVGALGASNTAVFGDTFGHAFFVNKLSSSLLAGVFSPALDRSDFEAAGAPLSQEEFDALYLGDYETRDRFTFGGNEHSARFVIMRKLGATADYDDRVERVCSRIVAHAALRDPAAMAVVYVRTLLAYFEPSRWRASFALETGLGRPLDPTFVGIIDPLLAEPVDPSITGRGSFWMTAFGAALPAYPVALAAMTALAAWVLARRRSDIGETVAAAGLLASLLAAPLYSTHVIPRYVMGATALGCVLVALLAAGSGRRPDSPEFD